MKSVLLIGIGRFGSKIGEQLLKMGNEVMIVDKNEEAINLHSAEYTHAIVANCMTSENLKSLNIPSFDCCIVAISDFQSSLEITSLLKDLKAKYIISKASTDIQKKFLLRCGADEVVYPDRDIAEKLAVTVNADNVYDFFQLDSDHSIFEVDVPDEWVGKSLLELNVRNKYGLNVLMIKRGNQIITMIDASTTFEDFDHMVIFGKTQNVIKFANKKNK